MKKFKVILCKLFGHRPIQVLVKRNKCFSRKGKTKTVYGIYVVCKRCGKVLSGFKPVR